MIQPDYNNSIAIMGNSNDKVQQIPKPPPAGQPPSRIGFYNQTGEVVVPNHRKSNSSLNNSVNPEKRQSNPARSSLSKQKNKANAQSQLNNSKHHSPSIQDDLARSEMKQPQLSQISQKNIKVNQSSVKVIESNIIRSELLLSALKVQGFEEQQFKGRMVKKFNIQAHVPEQDLIKESNYLEESIGDLGLKPKAMTKIADFSVGSFEHLNTFPVKTYLFDRTLRDRLKA